ncbi:MAG TPA: 4Fe-4S binding protein [Dehalococcoidales bacterium]|nr:4Fe-4S binding protein [Dehalococcoidales bacterium]
MAKITINSDLCIGCRWCATVCREGVFILKSEVLSVAIAPENCTLCMKCVGRYGCPERAIVVKK